MEKTDMPTKAEFERYLQSLLSMALEEGLPYLEISAKELHELVGGYPGPNHRMPVCCAVMKAAMKTDDQVLFSPPSGLGASLTIRYYLGR